MFDFSSDSESGEEEELAPVRKPVRPKAPPPVKVDTKRDEVKGQENSTTKPKTSTNYRYGDINSVHCVTTCSKGRGLQPLATMYGLSLKHVIYLATPTLQPLYYTHVQCTCTFISFYSFPSLFLPIHLPFSSSDVSPSPPPSPLSFSPRQAPVKKVTEKKSSKKTAPTSRQSPKKTTPTSRQSHKKTRTKAGSKPQTDSQEDTQSSETGVVRGEGERGGKRKRGEGDGEEEEGEAKKMKVAEKNGVKNTQGERERECIGVGR